MINKLYGIYLYRTLIWRNCKTVGFFKIEAFLQKTFVSLTLMTCGASKESLYLKVKDQKGGA